MTYDVKLTVADEHGAIVRWQRDVTADNPEQALGVADKRWREEWRDDLPRTEMRVYVYESGKPQPVLDINFRFDPNRPPDPHRAT